MYTKVYRYLAQQPRRIGRHKRRRRQAARGHVLQLSSQRPSPAPDVQGPDHHIGLGGSDPGLDGRIDAASRWGAVDLDTLRWKCDDAEREGCGGMVAAIRDRWLLLRMLGLAGPRLFATLVALALVTSAVPAATAVALALLVGQLQRTTTVDVPTAVAVPLLAFVAVLLLGHAVNLAREPAHFLARARIDGVHRTRVAGLASTSNTIAALERPEVQQLLREARADPTNWTERTPAAGALSQLDAFGRLFSLVSSSFVLAAYRWWLVPLLVASVLTHQQIKQSELVVWHRTWRSGLDHVLRAEMWSETIFSPGDGKEVRVFGLAGWAVERSRMHVRALYEPMQAMGRRIVAHGPMHLLVVLGPLMGAFVAVSITGARHEEPVGLTVAVLTASVGIYRTSGGDPRDIVGGLACLRAYQKLRTQLEEVGPVAVDVGGTPVAGPVPVRFEGVSFSYSGTQRHVLKGLDLEIRPGELLAIVGLNGAGKSTLIKLLAGLYRPTAGRITANGTEIMKIGTAAWRRTLAIVFQDFVRYHLTAADNVALGNASVPRDQATLELAARDAGLDEVLVRLPRGWETPLARTRTDGVDLSGGQWQQVVLARALYAVRTGAWLLVLDEPTAHLDVRTEFMVFKRISRYTRHASVVLISHRLSTVRQADRIVLLGDGRILESGTHDELMALGGQYAEMFAIQADRFNRGYDDRIEEGDVL
jgi:ABC-type multidrug transport system fused ATPase/permease subunit